MIAAVSSTLSSVLIGLFAFGASGPVVADNGPLGESDIITRKVSDGPVAVVDGVPIDSDNFLYVYRTQVTAAAGVSDEARFSAAKSALNFLIRREILYQEGIRRGFQMSEKELREAYESNMTNLRKAYAAQNRSSITDADLLAMTGKSQEYVLESLRKTGIVMRVYAEFAETEAGKISETDIEKYYRENKARFQQLAAVHLREIFVETELSPGLTSEQAWEAARDKATDALGRIRAGWAFAVVARQTSDATSAKLGGDLGSLPIDRVPPRLLAEAKPLGPGDLSGVIESENGFHIIQLVSRNRAKTRSIEEVSDQIRGALKASLADRATEKFCAQARAFGRVQILLEFD
jgi:peptidyl-prolyl cis-trans isomerase SurA